MFEQANLHTDNNQYAKKTNMHNLMAKTDSTNKSYFPQHLMQEIVNVQRYCVTKIMI